MLLRKSDVFLSLLAVGIVSMGLLFADTVISQRLDRSRISDLRETVRSLTLTDLCLFTEARYTRHPAMTDLHTPFQEHPLSLEHFPSGSLMAPPDHLAPQAQRER